MCGYSDRFSCPGRSDLEPRRAHRAHRAHKGKGRLTVKLFKRKSSMDLVQGNPLRSAAKHKHNRSAEQPAARSREGRWGNTYLLRQHPCTPTWDGIPTTNCCPSMPQPGQSRLTSPCRAGSRRAFTVEPSTFRAPLRGLRRRKLLSTVTELSSIEHTDETGAMSFCCLIPYTSDLAERFARYRGLSVAMREAAPHLWCTCRMKL